MFVPVDTTVASQDRGEIPVQETHSSCDLCENTELHHFRYQGSRSLSLLVELPKTFYLRVKY